MTKCLHCGKRDIGVRPSKKFCNLKCNRLYHKFKPNKLKPRSKHCGYCRSPFIDLSQKNRRVYCTDECYNSYFYASKYGLTPEDHKKLLSQKKCSICNKSPITGKEAHIDHDSNTGKVRGLLCYQCNVGLGNLRHDISILKNSIKYLKG